MRQHMLPTCEVDGQGWQLTNMSTLTLDVGGIRVLGYMNKVPKLQASQRHQLQVFNVMTSQAIECALL